MDTPLFYSWLFVHIISLVVGFGAVLVIDTIGFLWLIGRTPLSFVVRVAHVTQRLIWLGWGGLVTSGIWLLSLKGYIDALTWIKLFFVLMLGINGLFLHSIKKYLERYAERGRIPLLYLFRMTLASAVSQLGWWGALSIGFVHRHIEHVIEWPEHPLYFVIGISLAIGIIAVAGEIVFKKETR